MEAPLGLPSDVRSYALLPNGYPMGFVSGRCAGYRSPMWWGQAYREQGSQI
jgi:hypothetical protein